MFPARTESGGDLSTLAILLYQFVNGNRRIKGVPDKRRSEFSVQSSVFLVSSFWFLVIHPCNLRYLWINVVGEHYHPETHPQITQITRMITRN
jgi:hypothetical protein